MASSSSSPQQHIWLWTCCKCHQASIPIALGDCPECQRYRCIDCDVKSHIATSSQAKGDHLKANTAGKANFSEDNPHSKDSSATSLQASSREDGKDQEASHEKSPAESQGKPLSFASPTMFGPRLNIRLVEIAHDVPTNNVFTLGEDLDSQLSSEWQSVLPRFARCFVGKEFVLTSIHLFRLGTKESLSRPSILINSSNVLGNRSKLEIQSIISHELRTSGGTSLLQSSQLVFRESGLRRSLDFKPPVPQRPPICEPRNRFYHGRPLTGDSIGIQGSNNDTATFGCYLLVGDNVMALTVDHLVSTIPEGKRFEDLRLTHISEQDRNCLAVQFLVSEARRMISSGEHICNNCWMNRLTVSDAVLSGYAMNIIDADAMWSTSCNVSEVMQRKWFGDSFNDFRATSMAQAFARSGQRARYVEGLPREMDWILFHLTTSTISDILRVGSGRNHPYLSPTQTLEAPNRIKPGAQVKSIGRTSGQGTGQINSNQSLIFHGNYTSLEWCVIKPPEMSVQDWVEGGIGVDGDSGALIVDEVTNEVYGMLWGRTGEGPTTTTIFTPLREIMEDIQNRTGKSVEFPAGQLMPQSIGTAIPTTVPAAIINFLPPVIAEPEVAEDEELVESFSAFSFNRRGSSNQGQRPFPPMRYRGDAIPGPSTPRRVPRSNSMPAGSAERTMFPGSHTYFRQIIANEDEER